MKAVVKKQQTVDALVESFNGATAVYLLNYQGMTVEKDNALRKALASKGVKYHAVKNTWSASKKIRFCLLAKLKHSTKQTPISWLPRACTLMARRCLAPKS